MIDHLDQQYRYLLHYLIVVWGSRNHNNALCFQLCPHSFHYRTLGSVEQMAVTVVKVDKLVAAVVHTALVVALRIVVEGFQVVEAVYLIFVPTSYYS